MIIKFTTSIGPAHWQVPDSEVMERLALLRLMPGVLQNNPDHPIEVLLDNPNSKV